MAVKVVEKAHPNVFKIVKKFQEGASLNSGIPSAACYQYRRVIQRDQMIAELNHRFASNLEYRSGVSAHTNL